MVLQGRESLYQKAKGSNAKLKQGRQIQLGEQNGIRGWIGTPLRGSVSIKQVLYSSKKETRDSVAIQDPRNGKSEEPDMQTTTKIVKHRDKGGRICRVHSS